MQLIKNVLIFLLLISPAILAPLEAAEPDVKTTPVVNDLY